MSRSLPDRVAGLYYAHGLFCSSHPVAAISLAISVATLCCYPLVNLPMPGNAPRTVINRTELPWNSTDGSVIYVQQVTIRVGVVPWTEDLALTDAFRGPLYEVFNLLEIIRNYQDPQTLKTLAQVCLHVEAAEKKNPKKPDILPEYNCLILSPANLWQQSVELFNQDTNLIGTIFSYQNLHKSKISLAEMMFGMSLKETGIKRYPIRVRQRILQYAVTIIFKEYDPRFIKGLKHRLITYYPLHQSSDKNASYVVPTDETLHIFYPGEFNYCDFFPLLMTFFALFLYVYFSVRKIELVKSKIGMAFSACITVVASLSMSVGLCFFFGLTLSLSGKEVFPYLVLIVGLENVLVLTKSVVSTPAHLDVKIRVAQGLSKEGWSITKNLLTEVTILTIGLFTFVPAIQEFSIFAIVGLLNDFFLQMVFFSTTLAIDIRRTELSSETNRFHLPNFPPPRKQQLTSSSVIAKKPNIFRSKSHPRLNGLANGPTNVVAPNTQNTPPLVKIPKRLRLVHFWARTRIFQRAFMVWMVVWISMIIYNSGIVEHLVKLSDPLKPEPDIEGYAIDRPKTLDNYVEFNTVEPMRTSSSSTPPPNQLNNQDTLSNNVTEELIKLRPVDFPPWNRLSLYHWSSIHSLYNVSLAGQQVTILPTIKLAHAISPRVARQINNPNDVQQFQWQSFATAALDPLDFSDMEISTRSEGRGFNAPFVPSSPMEIFLAALLCLVSVIVVAYTMVVLYRCICSRNYAEWRASWHQQDKCQDSATQQLVMEAVPLVLEGHTQEVECIATDGNTIASVCLAGHVRIWDSITGELITHVDRREYFTNGRRENNYDKIIDAEEFISDYDNDKGSPSSEINDTTIRSYQSPNGIHMRRKRIDRSSQDFVGHSSLPSSSFEDGYDGYEYEYEHDHDHDHEHEHEHEYEYEHEHENAYETTERRRLSEKTRIDNEFQFPDLRSTINTNFANLRYSSSQKNYEEGFDFGNKYKQLFEDHKKCLRDTKSLENNDRGTIVNAEVRRDNSVESTKGATFSGRIPNLPCAEFNGGANVSPIWCIDYQENLIIVGCANGTLEFWEGTTGFLKCLFDDGSGIGISAVKFVDDRIVVAKLNGSLDFLQLAIYNKGQHVNWNSMSYKRTHVRTRSAGSHADVNFAANENNLRCVKIGSQRAHQQPITVLDSEGGRVLTGSQDHTLKVYRLEDQLPLYTLHGHCGPISCLFIDRISPMTSGSGSQDGLLCVWDLLTGACMYSIQAHDGAVAAITCSASYVISIGTDERLCVWERFQGHLLHALPAHRAAYSPQIVMLTHHLLITSNQGSLIVWDVRTGEPVREVRLGHKDSYVFVKQMIALRDSVVCDFSRQLRIVRFPLVSDKMD